MLFFIFLLASNTISCRGYTPLLSNKVAYVRILVSSSSALSSTRKKIDDSFDEDTLATLRSNEKELEPEIIKSLIQSKLAEWMKMKEAGLLSSKSPDNIAEEDVEEIEALRKKMFSSASTFNSTRRLGQTALREQSRLSTPYRQLHKEFRAVPERSNNDTGRALFLLNRKLKFCKSNPVELMNIFNLVKEKSIFDAPLLEEVLLALSRLSDGSQKSLVAAFEDYFEWNRSGRVIGSDGFFLRFCLACYSNNLIQPARHVEALLLSNQLAQPEDFRSGHLCVIIQQNQLSTVKDTKLKLKQTQEELNNFQKNIRYYSIEQINLVIRVLAKYRMTEEIFNLFDCIREARVKTNSESFEFLANAIVATIDSGVRADSMKDLPKASLQTPEIVFVGRSNVGKSSLINFLLNRKALASTSATPGHTKHFHFFNVNKDRKDVPPFCFVDVPGLGYAETVDENRQVSWKSLLQRYLAKRESLRIVCHLIDSRHKVTQNDKEMFEMAIRADAERSENGEQPFKYVVLLTKIDKVTQKVLAETVKDVRHYTSEIASRVDIQTYIPITDTEDQELVEVVDENEQTVNSNRIKSKKRASRGLPMEDIEIIPSSSLSKEGSDRVWKMMQSVLRNSMSRNTK